MQRSMIQSLPPAQNRAVKAKTALGELSTAVSTLDRAPCLRLSDQAGRKQTPSEIKSTSQLHRDWQKSCESTRKSAMKLRSPHWCFGLYCTMHELFIYQPSTLRLLNGPSVSSLMQHLTAGAGQLWTRGLRKASRRKTNLHEDPVTHQTESAFGGSLSLCPPAHSLISTHLFIFQLENLTASIASAVVRSVHRLSLATLSMPRLKSIQTIETMARSPFDSSEGGVVPARESSEYSLNGDVLARLRKDPHAIINEAPAQRFKLGYGSVMGVIVNRMIGMFE